MPGANAKQRMDRYSTDMKLKKNGAKLVNLVIDYANGDIDRWHSIWIIPAM